MKYLISSLTLMFLYICAAKAAVHPIEDVDVISANEDQVVLATNIVLRNSCMEPKTNSAVIDAKNEEILLTQRVIKETQGYCLQVISYESERLPLGDVPPGNYDLIDNSDKAVIGQLKVPETWKE